MSATSSDDSENELIAMGWIANYPPWFAKHWIGPANCKNDDEASRLLHFLRALEDGKLDDARRMLKRINPNLRLAAGDGRTESLLEWALQKCRNPECIQLLVAAGGSLTAPGMVYKLLGRRELLAKALKAGANPNEGSGNESPLIAACWGDADTVSMLLEAGASLKVTTTLHITNKKSVGKVTPLMAAAYVGKADIVKVLLEAGVDPKATDAAGNTALAWAKISPVKAAAKKIIALLEGKTGAPATVSAGAGALPEIPDYTARAKTPKFKKALALAKSTTKSAGKPVELDDDILPGARAFLVPNDETALKLLEELRPKIAALGAQVFLYEPGFEPEHLHLMVLPVADYREAIRAFQTPVGQSIDSDDLVEWLEKLEKTQPFVVTHLWQDLVRAKFTTPIKDSTKLAKSIEKICGDVINDPLAKVAKHLEKSRELYLWWD